MVAAHMASKLMENARRALRNYHITRCFGWTDTTVALHWIRDEKRNTNSLSANRFAKIQEKKYISWQYVPTIENCADVGSRGYFGDKLHAA